MDKLMRVDRNGTEYWESDTCPKCGGSGHIPYYDYVEAGRCFECGGTGHKHHTWKIYTPEYAAKLKAKRVARYKAKAPERNEKKLWTLGFDNGSIHVVLGDTYSIKENLKADGARFSPIFGWFFAAKVAHYATIEVKVDDVFDMNDATGDLELKSDSKEIIENMKAAAMPSKSDHLYNVGDKVELKLVLKRKYAYETHYTYYGELNFLYTFEDASENVYVWKTGKDLGERVDDEWRDYEVGDHITIKGTVKENGEYRNVKQTVLTRCKVVE